MERAVVAVHAMVAAAFVVGAMVVGNGAAAAAAAGGGGGRPLRMNAKTFMSVNLTIENDLGGGINLNTHCRSDDDDIGVHDIANGGHIQWQFNNSWLGTTNFRCAMKWGNNVQGTFSVYNWKRDFARCIDCWWSIRQDGAYCYRLTPNNEKFTWQLLYSWKK